MDLHETARRSGAKKAGLTFWQRGWRSLTTWHDTGASGRSFCHVCGNPAGTAFADCHTSCCVPASPLPFYF